MQIVLATIRVGKFYHESSSQLATQEMQVINLVKTSNKQLNRYLAQRKANKPIREIFERLDLPCQINWYFRDYRNVVQNCYISKVDSRKIKRGLYNKTTKRKIWGSNRNLVAKAKLELLWKRSWQIKTLWVEECLLYEVWNHNKGNLWILWLYISTYHLFWSL